MDGIASGKELVDRLTNLISIFQNPALDFSKNTAGGDDILGDAYEYLMRHFATESGKSKGQFYTPAEVSRIIAQVIGIHEDKTSAATTVYDPTCGSGSLLLKVADEAREPVTLYGQEKDAATSGLARMNMILHDNPTALVVQGNTLVFVDASEDDLGASKHVVVLNKDNIPFISGLHTIVAKPKASDLTVEYRCHCFQTEEIRRQFRFYAVGTKVSGISKKNIAEITMPIPGRPEQSAIAAILYDLDAEIIALENKLTKARALKQGMMQELLTGRIRLPTKRMPPCYQRPAERSRMPPEIQSTSRTEKNRLCGRCLSGDPGRPCGRWATYIGTLSTPFLSRSSPPASFCIRLAAFGPPKNHLLMAQRPWAGLFILVQDKYLESRKRTILTVI